jgi:ATP-binding cassette subfamily C (CFTR/MRP) protein 1
MIPMVFSLCSDAYVSLGRIGQFLLAEEQEATFMIKQDAEYAVDVEGDFTWEVVDPNKVIANTKGVVGNATSAKEILAQAKEATRQQRGEDKKDKKTDKAGAKRKSGSNTPVASGSGSANSGAVTPTVQEQEKDHSKPFMLEQLDLKIPRGSFVAISGRIGSGKSSVLNALIGEMRRTKGAVSLWMCTA